MMEKGVYPSESCGYITAALLIQPDFRMLMTFKPSFKLFSRRNNVYELKPGEKLKGNVNRLHTP